MFGSAGVRAAGAALVWGVGGFGGRAGRPVGRAGRRVGRSGGVDRGVAGGAGGVAATGGPGLLELLAAAEHGWARGEGESEGPRPAAPAVTRRAATGTRRAPRWGWDTGPGAAQAGRAAGASRQRPGAGDQARQAGAGRAVGLRGLWWRVGRRAGNGRVPGAGV